MILLLPLLMLNAPSASEIMSRVAENQARAQTARTKFVYDMNVFVRLKRANGKLAREESRDYVVVPEEKGSKRKLTKLEGKVLEGKKETPYTEEGYRVKNVDIDGEIVDSFAKDVMWNKGDFGPMVDWFPLTPNEVSRYTFTLAGEEKYRDYDVYKIDFVEHDEDDSCWRGEALIEKNEFQPVLVTAEWACRIPLAVKALLGTNVSEIGAKITYRKFDDGVWFPVNCGGELKLRVLFLYARTIAFTAQNSGFRKADVQTNVTFDKTAETTPSVP
ncbi:MAG: hypothetical protein KGN84_07120 [Acidobacteriota bacterium]|nr:hypothetical protein [Acidobacteriota bacterium]